MESIFSPRLKLPSTPQSASLHRPWERNAPSSSCSSDSLSSFSSSFPFLSVTVSAPATPSGQSSSSYLAHLYPRHLLHQHDDPAAQQARINGRSSGLFAAGLNSPFPAAAAGQYLAQLNAGGEPSSPIISSHGSLFSPYAAPPWSAPYSMQSQFSPLPSMPFNAATSNINGTANSTQFPSTSTMKHEGPKPSISCENGSHGLRKSLTTAGLLSANPMSQQPKSPPKKKRKPPPIQIDSSISNFSADLAHLHSRVTPASAGPMLSPLLSGGAVGSAYPLMSPLAHRTSLSLPPPSPLQMAAQAQFHMYHHHQQLQQEQQNAMRYMYEGPLTPLPSSGYGTKLKLLGGNENPAKCEWQPAESFRGDNMNIDFGQTFRVMSYIKHEQEGSTFNSVEFTLKPVDLPDKLNVLVKALCCHFHPFFDYKRGWVSLDPPSTREFYGLTCDVLRVADTVAVTPPAERPEASSSWTMMDTSATNILAEWAARNRHALSQESGMGDIGHWSSHRTPPSPHTPRQTKLKVKKEKKEKKEDKAKRPMNAFMLFAQEFRVRYTQEFPGRDNRAISCLLGEHWKRLSLEQRQEYTNRAKELAQQYKEKNPDCWKRRSRSQSDMDLHNDNLLENLHNSNSPILDVVDGAIDLANHSTRNTGNFDTLTQESDENSLFKPSLIKREGSDNWNEERGPAAKN